MLVVAENEQLPVREGEGWKPGSLGEAFSNATNCRFTFLFMKMVRSEQTSLDIVQETFISAVRNIGGLREDGRFGSWLFSIAHQRCIQHWRKLRPETVIEFEDEDCAEVDDGPMEWLIRKEREEEFMKMLGQLAEPPARGVAAAFCGGFFRSKKSRGSRERSQGP